MVPNHFWLSRAKASREMIAEVGFPYRTDFASSGSEIDHIMEELTNNCVSTIQSIFRDTIAKHISPQVAVVGSHFFPPSTAAIRSERSMAAMCSSTPFTNALSTSLNIAKICSFFRGSRVSSPISTV